MEYTSKQYIEAQWHFSADIEPFIRGHYGLPENSTPDEGGTANITGASLGTQGFTRAQLERMFTPAELLAIEEEVYSEWETSEEDGRY